MNSAFVIAPVVGLFSALHCVGMCGGIVGALTFSLPERVRRDAGRLAAFTVAYNAGRILSYALAGGLFGWLGGLLFAADNAGAAALVLRLAAALVTVAVGLYIAGWLPRLARIEQLGEPLWRTLEPVGRRLLPVHTLWRALLYGAIWGWLPCGLVYSVLLLAATTTDPVSGGLVMIAFGLGTMPAMIATGVSASKIAQFMSGKRLGAGLLIIVLGLATIAMPVMKFASTGEDMQHGGHGHAMPPDSD